MCNVGQKSYMLHVRPGAEKVKISANSNNLITKIFLAI